MFGYVTICETRIKVKDLRKYKAYYCGLCHILKGKIRYIGQMTLTCDMTFAIILLTSLYESQTCTVVHRCKVHPIKKADAAKRDYGICGRYECFACMVSSRR